MVFFKDFGKSVTDLFKKDKYAFNRKFTTKVKSSDTEWSTEHELSPSGSMKAKLTYVHKDPGMGSVEVKVPTSGDLEVDYSLPKMVDGLKTNVVLKQPTMDVKCKLTKNMLEGKVETAFNVDTMKVDSVYASAALGFDGLTVGAAAKLKPGSDKMFADYNVGLQYVQSDKTTLSLKTENRLDRVNAMVWSQYSEDTAYGLRCQVDMENPGSPGFDIGTRFKVDDKGTIQSTLSTSGETRFLYKHKLSDRLTASLGTTCDLFKFSADGTQMHYKLEFEA